MLPLRELWWHKYRRKQYRRQKLSLEMIIRKSFRTVVKEYVQQCSVAGVKEIADPRYSIKQRLVWLGLFVVMFSTTCYFLQYIWYGTLAKPLIVTMESSTYPIGDIDFPAIALCNINRISKKALKVYARAVHPYVALNNESLEEVENYALNMGRLLDYSWNENLRDHQFLDNIAHLKYNTRRVVRAMKELAPSCEQMLLRCAWAAEIVDCMSVFAVRRTVRGHCCAFNYILDYDSAGKSGTAPNKTIAKVKRQQNPGYLHGLNVILDPMVDDYAYPLSAMQGFDILLFDPTHFADLNGGRVIHRLIEVNKIINLQLQSVKQVATAEVRKYPLSTRKCLFHDEKSQRFGTMYSYSACIVNCRIKTVRSLCKCTPYFLPTGEDDGPVCTLDELRCLNKYKEKLLYLYPTGAQKVDGLETEMQDSLYCPDCLPDCELTQHFTRAFKIPMSLGMSELREFAGKDFMSAFVGDINLTNKCYISVYQSTADGILDRLDVISYWFEVLSNVGGFAGILLGFSFITVVEIFYFFFIRFLRLLCVNYKAYH